MTCEKWEPSHHVKDKPKAKRLFRKGLVEGFALLPHFLQREHNLGSISADVVDGFGNERG